MNMNHVHVEPRVNSFRWVESTGGALDRRQRLRLLGPVFRGYFSIFRASLPVQLGARGVPSEAVVPDSRLVQLANEAASDVPEAIAGHGRRTWVFGSVLAAQDEVKLDPELFYVGSLLHDAGLASSVVGEDFTTRSAALALRACEVAGTPSERSAALADGIVAHIAPGLSPKTDALGYYIQAGALLDLAGVRMRELPEDFVRGVYARHPNLGVRDFIVKSLAEERRAVPHGRTALLCCAGLRLAIRLSPTRAFENGLQDA
jgi:hypothetical protein